ncbi:hypothetical protein, partial [Komagataeibacter saccharivorans]|uniref:hypothetical protein n=1 Tax=Komagataeibacter saccharivorans TaxID=265959 RepID=UPI0039ECE778
MHSSLIPWRFLGMDAPGAAQVCPYCAGAGAGGCGGGVKTSSGAWVKASRPRGLSCGPSVAGGAMGVGRVLPRSA